MSGASKWRGQLLRGGVSLILLAIVWSLIDWQSTLRILRNLHIGWVVGAVLLAVLDRAVLNVKWQVLLSALGVHVRYLPLLKVQFAANLIGTVFPSSIGVDAFRSLALFRSGYNKAAVLAATLVDRLTIVGATVVTGLAVSLHTTLKLPATVNYLVYGAAAATLLSVIVLGVPSVRKRLARGIGGRIPATWHQVLNEAWLHGTGSLLKTRVLSSTAITLVAAIFIRISVGVVLARACGYPATIGEMALATPIIWVATMLPLTIGGLGLTEAAYVVAMGLVGISPETALAMSVCDHVLLRVALLPGLFCLRSLGGASQWVDTGPDQRPA